VLLQSGHTQEGKVENQRLAANLAVKGFVVLCFDPIGQGEREQTYSRQLNAPVAGWSVPEHNVLGAQAVLVKEGSARYFIWDAMRSIDYLVSRPDVDPAKLGAAGCSGGGALTTFTGGLDSRLKVVIPACYPSSFQQLFPTPGPDSEMVFPGFLAGGLDTADFVELSAPTPWLLQSTENDEYYFSHEGVRRVYDEAQKWYSLYQAADHLGFMIGPGWHGMPLVSREAVYQWMIRYLKDGRGDSHEQPVPMYSNSELLVTKTGHVADEPGSRKAFQLLYADYQARKHPGTIPGLMKELQDLQIPTDHSPPSVKVLREEPVAEGKKQSIRFESEAGLWLEGTLYIPSAAGRKPAVLLVEPDNGFGLKPGGNLAEAIAQQQQVVLVLQPRTSSLQASRTVHTGDWVTNLQANLIGRNLPAMRAHDILRGVDLLAARPDVDASSIRGAARGVKGIWLLLAAAADPRIGKIWLDHTPYSLQNALENSVTTQLWDAAIPGFLLSWDLPDLRAAMAPRTVLWTDPTDWTTHIVSLGPHYQYRYVLGDTTDLADAQDNAYLHQLLH
jgi:cephalosporin-C deacetylase-like acetyl esterase